MSKIECHSSWFGFRAGCRKCSARHHSIQSYMEARELSVSQLLEYRHSLHIMDSIQPKTCCRAPKVIVDHSQSAPQSERLEARCPVRLIAMIVFGLCSDFKTSLVLTPLARMVLGTSIRPLQLQLASPSSFHRSLRNNTIPYADNSSLWTRSCPLMCS